ncbi:MAG: glycoside hydrolase family 3 C-terminal domain-containing protein, partial [Saprospiraceae bacterium]|nr:glycoside hydrolase family 3 C-terminal domain-containing protein [Saprospiraceae bacterium]
MRALCFLLLALVYLPQAAWSQKTSVQNIDRRVEELLAKMNLDEKIGQLNQVVGDISTGTDVRQDNLLNQIRTGKVSSVLSHTNFQNKITMQRIATKETRLGIPLVFGFDVIHGYKTIFPIPLAQAATWNLAAIEAGERIAATEAAADGQNWAFSPMVDISRDPRWGRVMEGAGEDPYLGSLVAAARVRGFQGEDLSLSNTIAACTKHYAGYGFIEGGRDYNTVDMSDQRLRETVLPPFEAAARAGSATFMNAFNTLNGVPASMNKYLVTDILRGEWAWRGLVVSDWDSFGETIKHGAAENDADASAKCLTAGSDMDMAGGTFQRGLKKALEQGGVTEKQIDEAVRRVLRFKFELGLFDDPFRYLDPKRREQTLEKPEYRQAARAMAAESMVLLKNDGGLLPLDPKGPFKKIALIGPYANSVGNKDYMSFWTLGLGMRAYDSTKVVTPAQALKPALESLGFEVTVTEVCLSAACDEIAYSTALKAARDADLVIACVGERGFDCGESRSVSSLELPRGQDKLLQIVGRNNKPTAMILFNSRPLVFPWAMDNVPAILVAWQPGFEAGNALADVLTGKVNPSGKLPMTFPRNTGQIPLYYNHLNTGRPQSTQGQMWTSGYLDVASTPAYPFGYGLSYTSFGYSLISLNKTTIAAGETLEVSVTVTNSGKVSGQEVVQCYTRDLFGDISRPVKELKRFEKITLAPGESRVVTFKLSDKDLAYWNHKGQYKADPGKFKVFVGGNSAEVREADF